MMSQRECQEVSGRTATRGANIPVFLLNFFCIKVRLCSLASVRYVPVSVVAAPWFPTEGPRRRQVQPATDALGEPACVVLLGIVVPATACVVPAIIPILPATRPAGICSAIP